ncbi:MAG TPA: potassium-transporting ATPase subunit C [Solirubrobacteraceae bacterium]|jgi:K+-transporting ATPase ATPase C chain|nr:potassium-transporting ATPase subunit C [Solirubrobacteraceae bacterium]
MKRDLISSALAIVFLTIVLGVAYPLVITGAAQVAWPNKSNGSQIKVNGKVVGSKLLSQPFVIDTGRKDADGNPITKPDPKYFQPRPSQDSYNPAGTFFSNRGPNQKSAKAFFRDQLTAYLALEKPYDTGLTAARVPVDAVTTSGSGVDPHISQANARVQAHRIAAVRHVSPGQLSKLIDDHTDGRFIGLLGEPGVNVTTLNLALDGLS